VIIDLVGEDWKVEAIVDPSAQPGRTPPAASPAPGGPAAAPPAAPSVAPNPTEDAHRDDPEIEALDGTQLLTQRLGAQVIEEIPHG
jgi:DNA polymerase III subunit gamma/tau